MALLKPRPTTSRRFSLIDGKLVAEMSDVGPLGRVWDDACDEGLTVVSHRTDREVVYAVESYHRDAEGELMYVDLLPAKLGERHLPTVRLFND
jgi:hypothetical protein